MSVFNDDVLLIHIPKCAGTSARDYLLEHLPNVVDSIGPDGGPLPIDSVPLRHIEQYTGRSLDSWQRIVIPVRDPYAQAVSHWIYHADRYARGGRHLHDTVAALHRASLSGWLMDPRSDFRLWYEQAVRGAPPELSFQLCGNTGWFEYYCTLEDGTVPDNVQIMRMEDDIGTAFCAAVDEFCATTGSFGHAHRSPHQASKTPQYYDADPQAAALVAARSDWLIENYYPAEEDDA